ncbi:suppressor of cytokine signaling 6-like [Malaya genurostris]|uniref:suppressor of cytokine signaling 6-like n=1 Tax=Malaya genurostris TaxID=325434 RepID=UPI0026F3E141|nr:suppressor of cytokine signaling 6-like [Malaya genurostris]
MEEQKRSENVYRFKWFMSLSRKRSPRLNNPKENGSSDKMENNTNGVFFTLRKRFQKKLTSIKVKAYEPELGSNTISNNSILDSDRFVTGSSSSVGNNDFARIVIERHSQNPIRFSSPNAHVPVIPCGDSSNSLPMLPNSSNSFPMLQTATSAVTRSDTICNNVTSLDTTMEQMKIELLKYGWYWGKLTRAAAQKRLARQDNGTFLVRDSQTEKYQFTVSFRSSGITLHCRIDYKDNYWSFSGLTTPTQCETMIDLIEDTMKKSEFGMIGFVKQTSPLTPPFPVRLTKPINRFYEVSSLQHLCRFIIRQRIDTKNIHCLPLPSKLKDYIEENFYDL